MVPENRIFQAANSEDLVIIACTAFDWSTVWQTDRRTELRWLRCATTVAAVVRKNPCNINNSTSYESNMQIGSQPAHRRKYLVGYLHRITETTGHTLRCISTMHTQCVTHGQVLLLHEPADIVSRSTTPVTTISTFRLATHYSAYI